MFYVHEKFLPISVLLHSCIKFRRPADKYSPWGSLGAYGKIIIVDDKPSNSFQKGSEKGVVNYTTFAGRVKFLSSDDRERFLQDLANETGHEIKTKTHETKIFLCSGRI
jgi:hypothetical protein